MNRERFKSEGAIFNLSLFRLLEVGTLWQEPVQVLAANPDINELLGGILVDLFFPFSFFFETLDKIYHDTMTIMEQIFSDCLDLQTKR